MSSIYVYGTFTISTAEDSSLFLNATGLNDPIVFQTSSFNPSGQSWYITARSLLGGVSITMQTLAFEQNYLATDGATPVIDKDLTLVSASNPPSTTIWFAPGFITDFPISISNIPTGSFLGGSSPLSAGSSSLETDSKNSLKLVFSRI